MGSLQNGRPLRPAQSCQGQDEPTETGEEGLPGRGRETQGIQGWIHPVPDLPVSDDDGGDLSVSDYDDDGDDDNDDVDDDDGDDSNGDEDDEDASGNEGFSDE